jgi:hypothetical protein
MSLKTTILLAIAALIFFKVFSGSLGDLGLESDDINEGNSQLVYQAPGAYDVDRSVDSTARDKYTNLIGNGDDSVTLMVYMIGTDLESRSGMGTADLNEIIHGEISSKVNIILQTGGTKNWQNSVISSKSNQRYQLTNDGLLMLSENLGGDSMVDPDTLSEFIRYSKDNYPADRYELILWDHGGGSLTGFGYDELHPGDHMSLNELDRALDEGNTKFDFIGFDSCLMATLETALVLEPYADYMIASEELEPGIGWFYSDWITTLSNNTSIATIDLGKKIIDDYISSVAGYNSKTQATLSMIDLSELKASVTQELTNFSLSANELMDNEKYQLVADARSGSKEFAASSRINQIDLVHFALNMGTAEGKDLAEVLQNMIKYNRTSNNISNSFGVSVYFPYDNLSKLSEAVDTYEDIGMEYEYTNAIKSFGSLAAGGQIIANSNGGNNLLDTLLGTASESSGNLSSDVIGHLLGNIIGNGDMDTMATLFGGAVSNWLDADKVVDSAQYYSDNQFDVSALKITRKYDKRVIALPEDQWGLIQELELNVFIDDGNGFIDLGLDNVYEWNDDGDLIMEYDGTWLTLNRHVVSYYMISSDYNGDNYYIKGRVPAMLNDQLVNIIIEFDQDNPNGTVMGAMTIYDTETETASQAKGLIQINEGDIIDYLCDYYSYSGEYNDSYYLGESYIAEEYWTLENLLLEDIAYQISYRLTDIFNNQYWTPSISD